MQPLFLYDEIIVYLFINRRQRSLFRDFFWEGGYVESKVKGV